MIPMSQQKLTRDVLVSSAINMLVHGVMAMIDEVLTYCCFLFLKKPMDTQHGTKICRERDSRPKNILQCA